jgi:Ser/Thr protein kinase RdoA (MazF antagonist)
VWAAFELDPAMRLLSDWHALTFAVTRRGQPYICRVTPASHQPTAAILAELEWQHFVIERGKISAPRAVPSRRGQLAEHFEAKPTSFTAVLFEKLNGRPIGVGDWNPVLFKEWGRLVGSLHGLSQDFAPERRRLLWSASDFLEARAYIPDSEPQILQEAVNVVGAVAKLTPSNASFGMIHGDIYQENFLLGRSGLQLFDFDHCEYGYYVSDIAVSLYAALWRHEQAASREDFARRFLEAFWTGYSGQYSLAQAELKRLPLFLRLREVLIYIVARKKRPLSQMSPQARQLLDERGARIANQEPIVALDWPGAS